jgi:Flp pilus assembly protein TadB
MAEGEGDRMNLLAATIIATLCFFLLGFALTLIPRTVSPLWGFPISFFILMPALVLGIIIGMKVQNII